MEPISATIISVVSLLIILFVNLIKGASLLRMFIAPLLGGVLIFLIVIGVQLFFKLVLKVENEEEKLDDDEQANVGGNLDQMVDDNLDTTADAEMKYDNLDATTDTEMKYDSDAHSEQDFSNPSDESSHSNSEDSFQEEDFASIKPMDEEDNYDDESIGYDSSGYDINPSSSFASNNIEETVADKLGYNASPEDMARAIQTKMRQE